MKYKVKSNALFNYLKKKNKKKNSFSDTCQSLEKQVFLFFSFSF